MRIFSLIALLVIVLFGCAKKIAPTNKTAVAETPAKPMDPVKPVEPVKPVVVETKTVTAASEEVVTGKNVFEAKCGRCHGLKEPQTYTAERWVKIVDWMAPKANLNATEKTNVLAYVNFYAKK